MQRKGGSEGTEGGGAYLQSHKKIEFRGDARVRFLSTGKLGIYQLLVDEILLLVVLSNAMRSYVYSYDSNSLATSEVIMNSNASFLHVSSSTQTLVALSTIFLGACAS